MKERLVGAILAISMPLALLEIWAEPVVRDYGAEKSDGTEWRIRELEPPPLSEACGISPFAISFLPSAEFPNQGWDIVFLRLNILAGRHREVYGFDFGIVGNETVGEFAGVQVSGFYNKVGFSEAALQFAGILNRCGGDFAGLQTALAANITDGTMSGFQFGIVNRAARLDGLQIGLFNVAETGSGVQIGLWNSAQSLEGLQIGIGNCNADSSMPFFPVVNFAF